MLWNDWTFSKSKQEIKTEESLSKYNKRKEIENLIEQKRNKIQSITLFKIKDIFYIQDEYVVHISGYFKEKRLLSLETLIDM